MNTSLDKIKANPITWDTPIWDFHTHILPFIDDGSTGIDETMALLEEEERQGITDILVTPHYNQCRNDWDDIEKMFYVVSTLANEKGLDIRLHLGAELMYTAGLPEMAENLRPTLNGSDYLLLEFNTDVNYPYLKHAIKQLKCVGFTVVLAHMERYDCLVTHEERVKELCDLGVKMQVNASTIARRRLNETYLYYIEKGYIQFIGSDCHQMEWRSPNMDRAIAILVSRFGKRFTQNLLDAGRYVGNFCEI